MYRTTVKITGMACGMCEAHINDAIRKALPEAKKVTSSHARGEAVFLTDDAADAEVLRRAVTGAGYTFVSCESEPYEKKGLFGRRRP